MLSDGTTISRHEDHAANQRADTEDGRQWNGLMLFASCLDRSDIQDLFLFCVRNSLIRESKDSENDEDNTNGLFHIFSFS
jgi:hypothetical protein